MRIGIPASGPISAHIRSNAVGYVAVVLALTGSATALPGKARVQSNDLKPNAVKTKHIKDGQVRGADVAEASLDFGVVQRRVAEACPAGSAIRSIGATGDPACAELPDGGVPAGPAGGDLAGVYPNPSIAASAIDTTNVIDGAILGPDIGTGVVTGTHVAANALGGGQINEALLDMPARPAAVPAAAACNPTSTTFVQCLSRDIRFVGPGGNQAIVIASLTWFTDGLGGSGECQLRIGSSTMDSAPIGTNDSSTDATHTSETTLIGAPTGSDGLTADISVRCNETESQIQFPRVTLAVLGDVAPN